METVQRVAKEIPTSSLNILQLVHIGAKDKWIPALVEAISSSSVRKVDLTFNRIQADGAQTLANLLRRFALNALLLGRNDVGSKGAVSIADAIRDSPESVKNLDLRMNSVDDAGLSSLIQASQGSALESLQLDSNDFSNEAVRNALLCLSRPGSRIQALSLGKNHLNDSCLETVKCLGALQKLGLSNNDLSDLGLVHLATSVIPASLHLEVLDLRNNPWIGGNDAMALLLTNVRTHRSLKTVLLQGTRVSKELLNMLEKTLAGLHSERAVLMTIIASAKTIPRLGSASSIQVLPKELLGVLATML